MDIFCFETFCHIHLRYLVFIRFSFVFREGEGPSAGVLPTRWEALRVPPHPPSETSAGLGSPQPSLPPLPLLLACQMSFHRLHPPGRGAQCWGSLQ